MNTEYSCGAVLFTMAEGGPRYALAVSPAGDCGFPKGHREAGETEEQTALREIFEEVGVRAVLVPGFRRETAYPLPRGGRKHVTYFLARYAGGPLTPRAGELRGAPLLPYEEARAALSFETLRAVLDDAPRAVMAAAIDSLAALG